MIMINNESEVETKCRKFVRDSKEHTTVRSQKDRAEQYQDFFRGGTHQWSEEEYNLYKSKGVEPITINRCKPVLKGLLGMYLQSRQEVNIRPRRGGSATVAQVHKEVIKHTQDVSYADYVYCQVFMRGGIDTEAYLKLRIDRGMNVNGQPVIEGKSIWDISVDRNAIEYNLNDSAAYVIEREWLDQDEIKALWPIQDKEGKIGEAINSEDALGQRTVERLAKYASGEGGVDGSYDDDENEQIPDIELLREYRFLIHRVYWKEIVPALIVSDLQEQKMAIVTDEKKILKLHRKGKKSKRYVITGYAQKKLHETVLLGDHMLEDNPEPLGKGVNDYPIVRYSPIWDQGYAIGALDDVVSLNREENIHRTQTTRILNQTANSGWLVGSDNNQEYVNILKNFGSVTGIVLPKDKFGNYIEKIKPNELPVGHFTMGQQYERDIKRVSGVDDASQGLETGKADSGKALNLKIQSNRSANEIMFDNLYRSLEIFGNMLLKVQLANKFYTDEEIKAIVSESSMIDGELMAQARHRLTAKLGADLPEPIPLPPMDPNAMMMVRPEDKLDFMQQIEQGVAGAQQYAKAYPQITATWEQLIKADAIRTLLSELRADKGMYGVKVVISPTSPTERMSQFIQMDALMSKYGQLIPPEVFIDLTDLPQKDEIKQKIKQAQQAQQAQGQGQMVRGAA